MIARYMPVSWVVPELRRRMVRYPLDAVKFCHHALVAAGVVRWATARRFKPHGAQPDQDQAPDTDQADEFLGVGESDHGIFQ